MKTANFCTGRILAYACEGYVVRTVCAGMYVIIVELASLFALENDVGVTSEHKVDKNIIMKRFNIDLAVRL